MYSRPPDTKKGGMGVWWIAQSGQPPWIPRSATPKDPMERKLRTKCGPPATSSSKRPRNPSPGKINGNRGVRQVLIRGLEPVRQPWRFECAVHNLVKL